MSLPCAAWHGDAEEVREIRRAAKPTSRAVSVVVIEPPSRADTLAFFSALRAEAAATAAAQNRPLAGTIPEGR